MARTLVVMSVLVAVFLSVFPKEGECRRRESFYEWLAAKERPVKTFVPDVTDSTGKAAAILPLLKKDLEEMLITRKKITFEISPDKKDADITLACDVVEYFWSDSDPVDQITGIGPILMDAAMKENYARATVIFTITDAQTGEEVWKKKLKATLTGNDVTKENFTAMLSGRMMKVLTKGAMSKRVETNMVTGPQAR